MRTDCFSATISDFELHIKKLYTISRAEIGLPIQIEDAEGPLPEEGVEEQTVKEGERPLVSLNTRLNNRYMDLRAKHNEAIFDIKDGVCRLFQQYLWNKGFKLIHTPKLLGAASEGVSISLPLSAIVTLLHFPIAVDVDEFVGRQRLHCLIFFWKGLSSTESSTIQTDAYHGPQEQSHGNWTCLPC